MVRKRSFMGSDNMPNRTAVSAARVDIDTTSFLKEVPRRGSAVLLCRRSPLGRFRAQNDLWYDLRAMNNNMPP
jgi:hypothetical protein